MKNENNAINILIDKIISVVDSRNKKCSKIFKSTIWKINNDGTYQISYLGQTYNVANAMGTELSLGQSVWVMIPNGVLREMHIYGINK